MNHSEAIFFNQIEDNQVNKEQIKLSIKEPPNDKDKNSTKKIIPKYINKRKRAKRRCLGII